MANIIEFPAAPEAYRNKTEIANYLREVADHIDRLEVETEPESIILILIGKKQIEVGHCPAEDKNILRSASLKASNYFSISYRRRGGNIYERDDK